MKSDPVSVIRKVNNKKKKAWTNNLKDILDQANRSIDAYKSEHPNVTFAMTFQKPVGVKIRTSDFGMSHRTFLTHPRTSFRIYEFWSD